MKIAYIANIRLPTEKAHGYQIMRTASELATRGHEVVLYVPRRQDNHLTEEAHAFYGLAKRFAVQYVPCVQFMSWSRLFGGIAFMAQAAAFIFGLRRYPIEKHAIVYTRDPEIAWLFSKKGYPVFFNAHNWPKRGRLRAFFLRHVRGVICNSGGTEQAVRKALPLMRTAVIHNASETNPYRGVEKATLRGELGLSKDAHIILYTGHLYPWKGADTLLAVADLFKKDPAVIFVCVGGTSGDVERYKQKSRAFGLSNVLFLGHRPQTDMAQYTAAADVLLLPNTATSIESRSYTSPLKLFEYMASGTPIVASDLPSVRDIVDERAVFFADPERVNTYGEAIRKIFERRDEAERRAAHAYVLSMQYTWEAHAAKLSDFFTQKN